MLLGQDVHRLLDALLAVHFYYQTVQMTQLLQPDGDHPPLLHNNSKMVDFDMVLKRELVHVRNGQLYNI